MAKIGPRGIYPESRAGKLVVVVFVVACIVTVLVAIIVNG